MSYLIQNFSYTHYSLRTNWRVRTAFLARNFATIYALLANLSIPFNLCATTYLLSPHHLKKFAHYFSGLVNTAFLDVKNIKHSPIGVNFPRSAHYQALVRFDRLTTLASSVKTPLPLPLSSRCVTYPYFYGVPIAITPIAKSFLVDLLYRFLRISLSVWFHWPQTYKVSVHYTPISAQLRLLRFLNKYYYKIYHI
jgi:hypothetical protein